MCQTLRTAAALLVAAMALVQDANADLLYSASLKDGAYGGGFKVGTYINGFNASGSTGGNLASLGIVDSADGVTFTTQHDVINYSLGNDGKNRAQFRTTGTVSVRFKADLGAFVSGQPFVDNYGFDQFYSGQATFGSGMSRYLGADAIAGTADDRVLFGWSTWHNNNWYDHVDTANREVALPFDTWHHLGLAWGGPEHDFEVWVDGVLLAADDLPSGVTAVWGASNIGRGSAYNFALGEIHQRQFSNSSPRGIMFADLEIWNEYRPQGGTFAPVPEPSTVVLSTMAAAAVVIALQRRRRARSTSPLRD